LDNAFNTYYYLDNPNYLLIVFWASTPYYNLIKWHLIILSLI
jgi:hypothetical protein